MLARDRPAAAGLVLHAAGAATVVVGTFMPWIRSGARRRASYDLLEVADRLGFSPHGALGWAVRCWPLLPLLVVAAVVAAVGRWRWTAAVLTALCVAYVVAVVLAVRRAPRSSLIGVEAGTWVSLVGAIALALGGVLIVVGPARGAPGRAPSGGRS